MFNMFQFRARSTWSGNN